MKIKFGALVTDGRGKIGGHVASRNRAGAYMRTKVTPVNPNTSYQAAARTRLVTFSQGWRSLTQEQRNAWEASVGSFQKTDIFGDIKKPAGINLYISLNVNLAESGGVAIDVPPLPTEVVGPSSLILSAAAGTNVMVLSWVGGVVPPDTGWIVRATPQVSPGKNFVKSLYRNIALLPASEGSGYNLVTEYTARFGSLVSGQKVFVEVYPVNVVSGIKGSAVSTFVIVGA